MYDNITTQINESIERILRRIEQSTEIMKARIINTGQTIQDNINLTIANSVNDIRRSSVNTLPPTSLSHVDTAQIFPSATVTVQNPITDVQPITSTIDASADAKPSSFDETTKRANRESSNATKRTQDLPPSLPNLRHRMLQDLSPPN
jgi:hypothetical protein